jgi:hypothetical protein
MPRLRMRCLVRLFPAFRKWRHQGPASGPRQQKGRDGPPLTTPSKGGLQPHPRPDGAGLSCWTGGGEVFAAAAFATGVIVARLRAANAARMRMFIGILHLLVGRDVRLRWSERGRIRPDDNAASQHWSYASTGEWICLGHCRPNPGEARYRGRHPARVSAVLHQRQRNSMRQNPNQGGRVPHRPCCCWSR